MFYSVSMDLFFLLTIIALASYSHQFMLLEQDDRLIISQLNKLLRSVGWSRLNHLEVINYDNRHEQTSFSGIDLHIPSGEPNQLNVTKENVEKKYCMTTMLIGCVYTSAMVKFIDLTKPILLKCEDELYFARERERSQRSRYFQTFKLDKLTMPFIVHYGNYQKSCELFNTIFEQFANSRQMFDYMLFALIYLLEPFKKIRKHHVIRNHIQYLIASALAIRDIKTTIYPHNYKYDENSDENVTELFQSLKRFLKRHVKCNLKPYMKKYCILPKEAHNIDLNQISSMDAETIEDETTDNIDLNQTPSIDAETIEDGTTNQPLDVSGYSEDLVKLQIEKHVEEVINKYYLDLGFQYVVAPN